MLWNVPPRLPIGIKRAEEKLLKEDLRKLCRLESLNPGGFEAQLKQVKDNIAQLVSEKYKGALIRARAEKCILGEQPTKRGLSAEAKYVKKRQIVEI